MQKKIFLLLIIASLLLVVKSCNSNIEKPNFLIQVENNDKCGYITPKGKTFIPIKYDYCGTGFAENMATVCKDNKCGFINLEKKNIIKMEFDDAYEFSHGLAQVRKGEKWGFINKQGKIVIPLVYETTAPFREGLAPVCIKKDKCGFVNSTGKTIIPFIYNETNSFNNGLAVVRKNNFVGIINKNGKTVVPFIYSKLLLSKSNIIAACDPIINACGYMDLKNKLTPFIYKDIMNYSEDFGLVQQNNWFYLDKNWKPQKNQYETALPFSENLAVIYNDNKCGYINKSGKITIEATFDAASSFKNGIAAVQKKSKWGFIDKTGNLIIPYKYDSTEYSY